MLGLHSPQHGGVGIPFPIATPRGRSSKFPWKGTSLVTYVTMVPWVGNEKLRPLGSVPCFGRKLQTKKWMTYFPGVPLYCGRAGSDVIGCRRPTSGVFVCMLQTRVTLTAFTIATPRGRSVSFPTQGTMVTYVTWDVFQQYFNNFNYYFGTYCVSQHVWGVCLVKINDMLMCMLFVYEKLFVKIVITFVPKKTLLLCTIVYICCYCCCLIYVIVPVMHWAVLCFISYFSQWTICSVF